MLTANTAKEDNETHFSRRKKKQDRAIKRANHSAPDRLSEKSRIGQ